MSLEPFRKQLRDAFPDAVSVAAEEFATGARYGFAVNLGERRYGVRVPALADAGDAIRVLREWAAS